MEKFVRLEGLVAPLDRNNVDTDAIIPKQFLKSIKRSGFGPNAFDEWRYMDVGQPGEDNSGRPKNPNFVLNQPRYQGAEELLTRANFGCGFKAIIAESFADIFFNNCYKNGIVPIVLPAAEVEALFKQVEATPGYKLVVDLQAQAVVRPDGYGIPFQIDAFRKECLINGWDDIGLTLRHAAKIREFEEKRRITQPWLFA